LSDLAGADLQTFTTFLSGHTEHYTRDANGKYWFVNEKRPTRAHFDSMGHALMSACAEFPAGASTEELYRVLCLSPVGRSKRIERRKVSRELSRRTDLFGRVDRAKYVYLRTGKILGPEWEAKAGGEWQAVVPGQRCDEDFDPFAFFAGGFQFTCS
jgi:hypothetical protein